jgi:hypothetical protein
MTYVTLPPANAAARPLPADAQSRIRSMRRLAIGLSAALLLAACGGGGGDLTHDEFARKASRLCAADRAKVTALPRPRALIFFGEFLDRVVPIMRRERSELADLRTPPSDRANLRRLLRAWDDVLAPIQAMQHSAKVGDDAGIAFGLRHAAAANRDATSAARALGVDACGQFSPFSR